MPSAVIIQKILDRRNFLLRQRVQALALEESLRLFGVVDAENHISAFLARESVHVFDIDIRRAEFVQKII